MRDKIVVGLGALREAARGLEERARMVREIGIGRVTVSAAEVGARPRELNRSARRDVAAQLRRGGVSCVGVELWVPQKHFDDGVNEQRAVDALCEAAGYASELGELTGGEGALHTSLPCSVDESGTAVMHGGARAVMEHGSSLGVRVVDHGGFGVSAVGAETGCRVGLDCGLSLMRGEEPRDVMLAHTDRLGAVRVSDAVSGNRVRVGSGELDLLDLVISWTTLQEKPWLVVDLRGLDDAASALGVTVDRVNGMLPTLEM